MGRLGFVEEEDQIKRVVARLIDEGRGGNGIKPTDIERAEGGMKRAQWHSIVKGKVNATRNRLAHMAGLASLDIEEIYERAKRELEIISAEDGSPGEKAAAIVNSLTPEIQSHAMAALEGLHLLSASENKSDRKPGDEQAERRSPYVDPTVPRDQELECPTAENLDENGGEKTDEKKGAGRKAS